MEFSLLRKFANSSNFKNKRNVNDIEKNIKDDSALRISSNSGRILEDLIKEDRNLLMLLMVLGLYIHDEKTPTYIKVLFPSKFPSLLLSSSILSS